MSTDEWHESTTRSELFREAEEALSRGDIGTAQCAYERLVDHPEPAISRWAALHLGELAQAASEDDAAKRWFRIASETASTAHPWALLHLAEIAHGHGDDYTAESYYRQLATMRYNPASGWSNLHLGEIAHGRGEYEEARRLYGETLKGGHPLAKGRAHVRLGEIHEVEGDGDAAAQEYRIAILSGDYDAKSQGSARLRRLLSRKTGPIEERDVFLCHATADKEDYARPLVRALVAVGITCWFDEAEILWGERLSERISKGLASSKYVIVLLSDSFLKRNWPARELGSALTREVETGRTIVLPVLIAPPSRIFRKYQLLRDKVYLTWDLGPRSIAERLASMLGKSASQ